MGKYIFTYRTFKELRTNIQAEICNLGHEGLILHCLALHRLGAAFCGIERWPLQMNFPIGQNDTAWLTFSSLSPAFGYKIISLRHTLINSISKLFTCVIYLQCLLQDVCVRLIAALRKRWRLTATLAPRSVWTDTAVLLMLSSSTFPVTKK